MTSPNPKGLAAYLETDPEEVELWVEKGQLRLFAATLSYLTHTVRTSSEHKVAEIRTVLDPLLEQTGTTWRDWWDKKVRPRVKESPHFESRGNGSNFTYRLVPWSKVDDIPAEPLEGGKPSKKVKSIPKPTWPQWFTSRRWPLTGKDTLPSTKPPDKIIHNIGSCAPDATERLTLRTVDCALEFVNRRGTKGESAQKWLELLLAGLSRHQELFGFEEKPEKIAQPISGLEGLLQTLLGDGNESLLAASVKQVANNPSWRKTFAWGIWESDKNRGNNTRILLQFLTEHLSSQEWMNLRDDIALFAITKGQVRGLDRFLSYLNRDDRSEAIKHLTVRAALREVSRDTVAAFILGSRYAGQSDNVANKLNILTMAGLLLNTGISEVADDYRIALEQTKPRGYNPLISALWEVSRSKVEASLENQQQAYEGELAKISHEKAEQERLVQILRDEIAANREESRLDIRRGILTAVADTLQNLHRQNAAPEKLLLDVESGLEIALSAGGVEWYGKVGETVGYDPKLHQGATGTLRDAPVTIVSRGALVPGERTGDFILIKAKVERQPEGN